MKKILFMMSVLLSLGLFSACSSSDELNLDSTDNNNKDDTNVLVPVKDCYGYSAISDFFYSELESGEHPRSFVLNNNLSDDENPCIAINNKEEFEKAYTGDSPLPNIDFSNYTLIIGKIELNANIKIDNMSIRINNKKAAIDINCIIDNKGTYIAIIDDHYYWNLFPKFFVSEITVEVNKREGEI